MSSRIGAAKDLKESKIEKGAFRELLDEMREKINWETTTGI